MRTMVRLRPLTDADRGRVEALITAHFRGTDSYDVAVDDPADGTYARVAETDDGVVGAMALSTYDDAADLRAAMHLLDTVEPVPAADVYGLVHMGYVAADRTGEGIGGRLLRRLHEIGERAGVDVFVGDAWFHGGPDTPEYLLTANGYEVAFRRPMSGGHGDDGCPKCDGRCACEAALVVRPA